MIVRIREDLVEPEYLVEALRRILPTLEVDDLVGRETFKKEDLLNIRIPKQPQWFQSTGYKQLKEEAEQLRKNLVERNKQEIDDVFELSTKRR